MDLRRYLRLPLHLAIFLIATVVAAVFLSMAFFWGGIMGGFLAAFILPALAAWAAGIMALHLYRAIWRRASLKPAGLALLVICATPLVFFATFRLSDRIFSWGTFAANYQSYRRIIALAEQGHLPAPGKTAFQTAEDGTSYEVERKPPHRIAFEMPGGFLSNRTVVLYDPNGVGMRKGIRQKNGSTEDLFGEWWTIGGCYKLTGRFYVCGFS